MKRRPGITALLIGTATLMSLTTLMSSAPALPSTSPTNGRPAPIFILRDIQQRRHSLAELRGRPIALFFFCGCVPCHRCASLWAEAQQSGLLDSAASPKPITVAVFMGDAASARAFAAETALDPKQTLLLTDPQEKAATAYSVTTCPRFFIINSHGVLCRTNNEPGTDPQTTPATVLISRAQTALQHLDNPTISKAVTHAPKR